MPPSHGTTTGYARGCRCDLCRKAMSQYGREHREAKRAGTWQDKRRPKTKQQCSAPGCEVTARFLTRHGEDLPLCGGHRQQVDRGVELTTLKPKNKIRDGWKVCPMCGRDLPLSDYYRQSSDRPQSRCKDCTKIATRARRYGVPVDEMAQMMLRPCEGCGSTGLKGRDLHIDHCHDSGRVRGVLCRTCNLILTEHVTPETLRSLAAYLEASADVPVSGRVVDQLAWARDYIERHT